MLNFNYLKQLKDAIFLVAGLSRNAAHNPPPANLHGVTAQLRCKYSCPFVVDPLNLVTQP
jgi:hypothetical protein